MRCRDLRRRDFEVEKRLVAGRSGAAKVFPAERTYLSADLSPARLNAVFRIVVVGARLYRWADALPLACGGTVLRI